jgi:hypothetical protein
VILILQTSVECSSSSMNGLASSFLTSIIAVSNPSCLVLAPVFSAAILNF